MPKQKQEQVLSIIQELSLKEQRELKRKWNKVLKDSLAFVPNEERQKTVPGQAREANIQFGEFASKYLSSILGSTTIEERLTRIENGKKILVVGPGLNYDAPDLETTTHAGYQIFAIDISQVACKISEENLKKQWDAIDLSRMAMAPLAPQVIEAEFETTLARPSAVGLDLASVDIYYLCRFIGCMSDRAAKSILHEIGRISLSQEGDQEKKKKVVVINAYAEDNPGVKSKTSKLRSREFIVSTLSLGAGRPLRITKEQMYMYFKKNVTAMTIIAE